VYGCDAFDHNFQSVVILNVRESKLSPAAFWTSPILVMLLYGDAAYFMKGQPKFFSRIMSTAFEDRPYRNVSTGNVSSFSFLDRLVPSVGNSARNARKTHPPAPDRGGPSGRTEA
jgi:hypothetical protein